YCLLPDSPPWLHSLASQLRFPLMRVLEHSRSECLKRRSLFGNRDRCYEVCIPKSHHDCTLSKPYPAEPETNPRTINQVPLKAKGLAAALPKAHQRAASGGAEARLSADA